jgi:hypothetical protein
LQQIAQRVASDALQKKKRKALKKKKAKRSSSSRLPSVSQATPWPKKQKKESFSAFTSTEVC